MNTVTDKIKDLVEILPWGKKKDDLPHNGEKEIARRICQMESGFLKEASCGIVKEGHDEQTHI